MGLFARTRYGLTPSSTICALGSEPNYLLPRLESFRFKLLDDRSTAVANEFWMSDRQWACLEPLIPLSRRGVKPRRNREVISGILHVLKVGCRWRDCPAVYGPHTTIYNRFNRWSKGGIWQAMLERLVDPGSAGSQSIDSTSSKAHRCAAGGKGGPKVRQSDAAGADEPPRSMPLPTQPAD